MPHFPVNRRVRQKVEISTERSYRIHGDMTSRLGWDRTI